MNKSNDPDIEVGDIIHLTDDAKVDEGGERVVFVHPDDPKRLIKVIKPRQKEEFYRWTFGHLSQRFFPSARLRPTIKQYHEYQRLLLLREYDPNFQLPISHLYGFVKTNLGLGCITERVTDPTGDNAPTLATLVLEGRLSQNNLNDFNAYIASLYEIGVCVGDVGSTNFVYGFRHIGKKGDTSGPSWVLIDGFGDRFAIPIRTISQTARRLGLDDAFKRKPPVAGLQWRPKERQYSFTSAYRPTET
ncbi:MAG: YrbL family protein [Pseudomonadota bacterium]